MARKRQITDNNNKPITFFAFANEKIVGADYLRNLSAEARRLRNALRPAEKAGLCLVVERSNCTVDEIIKVFQDSEYRNTIANFHYGGQANGYQLLLESPAESRRWICPTHLNST